MAIPIKPTPVLEGEDIDEFYKKMDEQENQPKQKITIPNLEKISKAIEENKKIES